MQASEQKKADLDSIGGRWRAAREASRLSVATVADRVGISRVSVYAIEKGKVPDPTISSLLAFTKLCDIDLNWLAERTGPDPEIIANKPAAKSKR